MMRVKGERWDYFKLVYDSWGFVYYPYIEKLRPECYLNKKSNVIVYCGSRYVEAFRNIDAKYNGEFDLIFDMTKSDILEYCAYKEDEDFRLIDRIERKEKL